MKMTDISTSSTITGHGYDPETKTAAIRFKTGLYHYDGVSQEDYDALVAAKSMGSHFHKNWRAKYNGVKQP